jgi:RecB family exonuclease
MSEISGILSNAIASVFDGMDYSGILYLCPTRHILSQRRLVFHRIAAGISGRISDKDAPACYIPPSFHTLAQLGRKLQSQYSQKQTFQKTLRPALIASLGGISLGQASFVSDFIYEMKHQFPDMSSESIYESLGAAYEASNAPDEVIKRGMDALNLMSAYDDALDSQGLMDEDDTAHASASHVERLGIKLLVLDGFYELTPSEEKLVHALVAHASETLAFVPISGPDDDLSYCYSAGLEQKFGIKAELMAPEQAERRVSYFPAASIEAEVEEIARHIKASYLNSKNRELDDTWVVFPVMEPYRNLASRVFTRFGIPHSFSSGRPCISHPAYQGLMALLESANDGMPRLAFTRFLTCPHFTNVPEVLRDKAASVGLSSSLLKGKGAWIEAFDSFELGKEIRSIINTAKPLLSLVNSATYHAIIKGLLEVSGRLGFSPPGGLPELENILRSLGQLDRLMGQHVSLAVFIDVLRSALSAPLDEKQGKGVRIASIFDVRGLEPRMLYMGGLKDGDFPSRPEIDFILPDNIRRKLGLLDMRRFLHLQARIFKRLSSGAKEVFYSYPTMEGDKYFLSSSFISDGEPSDFPTGGIYCDSELQRLRSGEKDNIQFIEISGIPRSPETKTETKPFKVTDVDSYRRCPRRYFIEKMLGLSPSEIMEYEVETRDLGIIAHKVMQNLISSPLPSPVEFRAKASEAIDKAIEESKLDTYQKALLKETFMNMLDDIYKTEEKIKKDGYRVHGKEAKVECEIEGTALAGKADRIDRRDDGTLEIIDYKTGKADISGASALRGESLQLFLYAAMLKEQGLRPERVGIYSLKDVNVKWVPGSRDKKEGNSLDDFMGAASHYLKDTAAGIMKGDFPAAPLKEQDCARCGENPYCPFVHGGAR